MILSFFLIVYFNILFIQANRNNDSVDLSSLIESIGTKQFFNCDIGDGVRVELVTMLRSLNQNMMIASRLGNKSPYKQYFENNDVSFFTGKSGKVLFPTKYNHVLHMHNSPNKNLYEDDIIKIFTHYQNDDSLSSSDAVICSYPFSMCEGFMAFNKSIIWIASHRLLLPPHYHHDYYYYYYHHQV